MAIPREVGRQKKLTNTRELLQLKQTLHLTKVQKEFLFGTLLGDGCLITSRSGKSARLQVRQNIKYKDYVWWKYSFFKDWVLTKPREDPFNQSFYFRTVSHPELMSIKKLFYFETKRFVPNNIFDMLKSPFSLAVWMMDDGNGHKKYKCYRISSYGFGKDGNIMLQKCLLTNYSLHTILYKDSKGYYLYFRSHDAQQLYYLIRPYILPCMLYKFASLTP